ncbi:hypothetical protein BD414DRAFT_34648 [Trametes punicea]|nr:hypothetical protein BD414DRAFT_34648 [Trametes punicea]
MVGEPVLAQSSGGGGGPCRLAPTCGLSARELSVNFCRTTFPDSTDTAQHQSHDQRGRGMARSAPEHDRRVRYPIPLTSILISSPTMSLPELWTRTRQAAYNTERSWYRKLFYDHPGYMDRDSEAMERDKPKVWCIKCFEQRVCEEQRIDSQSGRAVRAVAEIEHQLWALPKSVDRSTRPDEANI